MRLPLNVTDSPSYPQGLGYLAGRVFEEERLIRQKYSASTPRPSLNEANAG
jgi:hypothetical protein